MCDNLGDRGQSLHEIYHRAEWCVDAGCIVASHHTVASANTREKQRDVSFSCTISICHVRDVHLGAAYFETLSFRRRP